MKKIILVCLFLFIGCDKLDKIEKLEDNISIIKEVDKEDDIPMRMEDSVFENIEIEENLTKIEENQSIKDILDRYKNKLCADDKLKKLIGNMFIVGFYGTEINETSQIVRDIFDYHLGGVILFDKDPSRRGYAKNIKNPKQLASLTKKLQDYSDYTLFISVDQEGGRVARLRKKTGFKKNYPSAKDIGTKYRLTTIKKIYNEMGKTLADVGINLNFAPSVDMAINPENIVIIKNKRSYGKDS